MDVDRTIFENALIAIPIISKKISLTQEEIDNLVKEEKSLDEFLNQKRQSFAYERLTRLYPSQNNIHSLSEESYEIFGAIKVLILSELGARIPPDILEKSKQIKLKFF